MKSKLTAIIQIIRPINFLITFLSIAVAGIICTRGDYLWLNILLAAFAGALTGGAGNIINDIFDVAIDRINRPHRALPAGKLLKSEALGLYIILNTLALILSLFINQLAFIIVLITTLLIFLYSYKIKQVPLVGNLLVGMMTGLAFIFGGVAVSNYNSAIIPAVFALLVNFIREIIKDMEDVEGDSRNNVITFPQAYGFRRTTQVVFILTLILMLFTLIPFIFRYYKIEYFVLVMPVVNVLFVYFLKLLLTDKSRQNLSVMSNILKVNMLLGLAAIYLGNK